MGINSIARLMSPEARSAGRRSREFVDQIDYVVELVGIDHVGIGLDISEGMTPEDFEGRKVSFLGSSRARRRRLPLRVLLRDRARLDGQGRADHRGARRRAATPTRTCSRSSAGTSAGFSSRSSQADRGWARADRGDRRGRRVRPRPHGADAAPAQRAGDPPRARRLRARAVGRRRPRDDRALPLLGDAARGVPRASAGLDGQHDVGRQLLRPLCRPRARAIRDGLARSPSSLTARTSARPSTPARGRDRGRRAHDRVRGALRPAPADLALRDGGERHLYEFGTTPEQLAEVAVAAREWALPQPGRLPARRRAFDVDDVLASPVFSSPLHRLDCCLQTDGGGAVVLTSLERARHLKRPRCSSSDTARRARTWARRIPDLTATGALRLGPGALAMAGLTPEESTSSRSTTPSRSPCS